ncbi:helix-turn-helix domain-containing protein [Bifidobacterium oedipodis]|uniref:Excisionase n=1 Tax=Bifidobacterium oedipodis TaxID=2675322 RepID=A0A7Y0EPH3_9BIFI|nr:helix-turn-helix domain-containing protein [Bifidobacterium sp. DSM 109957]NMM94015.1 excisionase [Bifidobacterium sp. DSM 109957]
MTMPAIVMPQDASELDDRLYETGAGDAQVIIPRDDQNDTSELERITTELLRGKLRLVDEDGEEIRLGEEVREAFAAVTKILNSGNAVSIKPERRMLSTSAAAELLGVSRQTMIRLLDKGEIPYTRPSNHRRVALEDVMRYQTECRRSRIGSINALHEVQESFAGVAENIGVQSEQDVQALVDELRHERR